MSALLEHGYINRDTRVDTLCCLACGNWVAAPKGTTYADIADGNVIVPDHLLPGYRHVRRVCPGAGMVAGRYPVD